MKFLIIGPTLQTSGIGGVTMHVSRLCDYLKINHFDFHFMDYRTAPLHKILHTIAKVDVVHIHLSNAIALLIFTLWARLTRTFVLFTLHCDYQYYRGIAKMLIRLVISIGDRPIIINKGSYDLCKHINKNCLLLPAFIPPCLPETLDLQTERLITRLKQQSTCLLCSTNAYNVTYDKNGNDLYGIDFLIKTFAEYENLTLLISDPSGNYSRLWKQQTMKLPQNIHFISYPHKYFELLKRIDIFIRNTSTDGDSLSVKEALFLGRKTLCSDAVDRPQGTFTFHFNDKDTFNTALQQALSTQTTPIPPRNAAEDLLQLYRQLLF